MFMWRKGIHSDKCSCALVKKSSVHVHSYLILIYYLSIYYVCQIVTTYLQVVIHQKALLKKNVVCMCIGI